MAALSQMFHIYLADLFPPDAEFVDDGHRRLRIIYPVKEVVPGHRYSRPIVLDFEPYVVVEFQAALDSGNVPRQDRMGDALCEIVSRRLTEYDVAGPQDSAFQIYVDSRATDL
jgi:hypothetical protein